MSHLDLPADAAMRGTLRGRHELPGPLGQFQAIAGNAGAPGRFGMQRVLTPEVAGG
jgi:hypothetical protein